MEAQRNSSPAYHRSLSRRSLIGVGLGAAALVGLRPIGAAAWPQDRGSVPTQAGGPAGWRTWLLTTGAELRPAAPGAPGAGEIAELLDLQSRRTEATAALVERWGNGPSVLPWSRLALDLIVAHKPNPPRTARLLALLYTAAADAVVAAHDAQAVRRRPGPIGSVPGLVALGGADGAASSFVSEQATVAGAAATVLAALFPGEPADRFDALAEEAAMSRLWAGLAYRSDVETGLRLGRAIGERALVRATADGSDAVWDGERPTGPGVWEPTPPAFVDPPLEPLAGTWRPWVIDDVVGARPAGPPPHGSPAWLAEVAAVQEAVARRTPAQVDAALFWAGGPGTVTPAGLWIEIAHALILKDGLDSAYAARALALTSVAMADAFICCWDAKFAYWMARPITADPTLDVLFPTPPFPSYTSGHSTISAAAATILGHLFPRDAVELRAQADEAKLSRLWAGIHFPVDNEVGAATGGTIGRIVANVARGDGAESAPDRS
jgi:hypothetical protein